MTYPAEEQSDEQARRDERTPVRLRDPLAHVWALYRDRDGRVGREIERLGWSLADVYLELGGDRAGSSALHDTFAELFNGQARTVLSSSSVRLDYWAGLPEKAAAARDSVLEALAGRKRVSAIAAPTAGPLEPRTRALVLAHNQVDAELHAYFSAPSGGGHRWVRPAPRQATAVCVLGMSRSGTSLTARVLDILGVELGTDEELMPPASGNNPAGFWEHQAIADLNEQILATLGDTPRQRWRRPPALSEGWQRDPRLRPQREAAASILRTSFAGKELWGWKDPRTCLTLPLWREAIGALSEADTSLRYVICVRHPLDVAASLEARDGMPCEEGLRLWRRYMSDALAQSEPPRLVVSYEDYFSDLGAVTNRLARFIGRPPPAEAESASILAHLDADLWHHRLAGDPNRPAADDLPADVESLYTELRQLSAQA